MLVKEALVSTDAVSLEQTWNLRLNTSYESAKNGQTSLFLSKNTTSVHITIDLQGTIYHDIIYSTINKIESTKQAWKLSETAHPHQ